MCLRQSLKHRHTPWLPQSNRAGAALHYSPPKKTTEGISIHHNSLATQDSDSSTVLFLPNLAGTVSLCSIFWRACIFLPLSARRSFLRDGFQWSPGSTGDRRTVSPGTPTLLTPPWGSLALLKEKYYINGCFSSRVEVSALKKGLCFYSCDHRFLLCEPLTEDITFSAKFVLLK